MNLRPPVMLVHGLWYGRLSMVPLARRFGTENRETHLFRYRSVAEDFELQAEGLLRTVQSIGTRVDFVAHSLGGLVVLKMLSACKLPEPGRIVLLGTPLNGSRVVRRMLAQPGGGRLFGRAGPTLAKGFNNIPKDWQVGMIAGSKRFGLGLLVGAGTEPGDGTVTRNESQCGHLAARIERPVGHTALLFLGAVFRAAIRFLEHGSFAP